MNEISLGNVEPGRKYKKLVVKKNCSTLNHDSCKVCLFSVTVSPNIGLYPREHFSNLLSTNLPTYQPT